MHAVRHLVGERKLSCQYVNLAPGALAPKVAAHAAQASTKGCSVSAFLFSPGLVDTSRCFGALRFAKAYDSHPQTLGCPIPRISAGAAYLQGTIPTVSIKPGTALTRLGREKQCGDVVFAYQCLLSPQPKSCRSRRSKTSVSARSRCGHRSLKCLVSRYHATHCPNWHTHVVLLGPWG